MNNPPPTEYAASAEHTAATAYRSIAEQTGLSMETVARIGLSNNLPVLFGDDGKLRSPTELRSMAQAGALDVSSVQHRSRTVQEKLVDLYEIRWPSTQTPSQKLAALRDMRLEWELPPEKRCLAERFRELETMRPAQPGRGRNTHL